MTDFFISYTGADQVWAEWIGWVLEEEGGYKIALQAWDFLPGESFMDKMHEATQKCERTILVLSHAYLSSHFGKKEWEVTLAQKKRLLPVRIQEVEPPGLLADIVYIDLVGLDDGTARNTLLAGAKGERAKPVAAPAYPAHSIPRLPLDVTSIPEEKIPEPGLLPKGSRMPFAVNPLFVGREDELLTLASQLKANQTSAIGQVEIAGVTGLGGIGKTQLASEFVHRYSRYFEGGVFWMSFADPAAVPVEVAACGRSLDLHPSYDSLPLEQQVLLMEEAWRQRPIPSLLVFDNCEDEALLDRWRPRFGGARVLVTSRRSRWDRSLGVRAVPITILPRVASIELLRKFRPDVLADDPALAGIAAELGDLPLALHLAGSFLLRYASSPIGQPSAYLSALRQKGLLDHPSLQGQGSMISPTGHTAHVARTFVLSFEQLNPEDDTDALALALLARAAYFASGELIPRDLLLKTVNLGIGDPDDSRPDDALERLKALGLLEATEDGALVIHRLLASFAQKAWNGEETQMAVEEALLEEADRLNNAGVPGPLLAWQAHLRAVTEGCLNREDETAAGLANTLGFHLTMIGEYPGARPYYERALAINEKVLGPEHPDTALSLNNLGALLRRQGDFAGARPYYERALAIRQKVLGPEHPDTARSLNNLGGLLQSHGDLAGARPYYERALAIWEARLGSDHPDTKMARDNLATLDPQPGDEPPDTPEARG